MADQLTCLLVDDDPDDQEIFAMAVEAVNAAVTCHYADDGIKALEMLSSTQFVPDLIFVDLNMPRMNGKQCLAEIKKIERLVNVPVYIYSTSSHNHIKGQQDVVPTAYITKPSTLPELTKILKGVLPV
ncbi:MAG: response regulator [Chitinophagaceae bacterium]